MKHVLVIAPHFDDETFGCGGSIARTSFQENIKVSVVFVLDSVSGAPFAKNKEEALMIRKGEAREAGKIIGVSDIYFLDFRDRGFTYSRKALHAIIRIIRQCHPTSVWFPHELDGDIEHKIVHKLVKEASWMAAGPYFPEIGSPAPPIRQLLCYEIWTPLQSCQTKVDITSTIEKKRRAIECYASQVAQHNYSEAILGLNRYRASMSSEACYVEGFQVLKTPFEIPE